MRVKITDSDPFIGAYDVDEAEPNDKTLGRFQVVVEVPDDLFEKWQRVVDEYYEVQAQIETTVLAVTALMENQ